MWQVSVAVCAVVLAGCAPSPSDTINAEAAAEMNAIAADAINAAAAAAEPAPPHYVAAPDDPEGANAMESAQPGRYYYRDLPAGRLLRGDWIIRKAAWFPVGGHDTPARVPARMAALVGGSVRIDRQRILVTPRDPKPVAKVTLDCSGVGYLDKERLAATEIMAGNSAPSISREDVLAGAGIAVSERDLSHAFNNSLSDEGQVLALLCPLSDMGDAEEGTYPDPFLTGALVIDRNHMVLIFDDGTALYSERKPQ